MFNNQTTVPQDRDAERGLIGACLDGKFDDVRASGVGEAHFFDQKCLALWRLMHKMEAEGVTVNSETVIHRASKTPSLSISDVLETEEACPTSLNWPYFVEAADDQRKARRVMEVGLKLTEAATSGGYSAEQLASEAESVVFELNTEVSSSADSRGESFGRIVDVLADAHQGKQVGVPTGFAPLDRILGGMRGGQLITLAARPAVGKSALACNIAEKLALDGVPVGFFSFEMSQDDLNLRMLCSLSDVDLLGDVINQGEGEERRAKLLTLAGGCAPKLRHSPLMIDDDGGLTVSQIASRARRWVRDRGIRCLIVDYMQLIQPMPEDRKAQRHVQVASITRGLKRLAMELNIPVIGLAQLGRQVEDGDGRPRLRDLAESSSIEKDSDVVLFLYVKDARMQEGPKMLLKLAVGKNRAGRQGEVDLVFVRNKLRFETTLGHEDWLNAKSRELSA